MDSENLIFGTLMVVIIVGATLLFSDLVRQRTAHNINDNCVIYKEKVYCLEKNN